jgi:hypothetical protein
MRFKPLKHLTPSKPKEKPEADQDEDEFKAIAANRIADMEKRIHIKTKDLEAKVQEIQGLSQKSDEVEKNDDIPRGPHGPISELTLENDNNTDGIMSLSDITEDEESEDEDEEIKLVEVKSSKVVIPEKEDGEKPVEASAAPEKSAEKEGEIKLNDRSDSLNNLFNEEEDEENPLANLIKVLPDVTAQELIDDIAEIKGIIKEWQKK